MYAAIAREDQQRALAEQQQVEALARPPPEKVSGVCIKKGCVVCMRRGCVVCMGRGCVVCMKHEEGVGCCVRGSR